MGLIGDVRGHPAPTLTAPVHLTDSSILQHRPTIPLLTENEFRIDWPVSGPLRTKLSEDCQQIYIQARQPLAAEGW